MNAEKATETFWDASALLALLLVGPNTNEASRIWHGSRRVWCWGWTQVEVESTLGKRRALPETWTAWRRVMSALNELSLEVGEQAALCQFNRTAKLSAAVAGQLFVFDRAAAVLHDLELVTFDKETKLAAEMLAIPLAG